MSVGDDDTVAGSSPTTTSSGSLSETELIAGRYRIVRYIGGGGMGSVYEVVDTELDEHVALKVLKRGISEDSIERFRREVKLTRRINHRNVARMHDIGEHAQEKFLTMELVHGEPLSRVIGDAMPWATLKSVAEQICAGLTAAHAAGVVHRDLKPDNVLLERGTDRVVITDFGIARGADMTSSVTQIGAVVGTPRYMAPEQLAGQDVDARADLFSLGVMLFELATGTRPWAGDNAVAIAIAQATTPSGTIETAGTDIPAAFVEIVAACLQLDAKQRPADAELVRQAIATGNAGLISQGRATAVAKFPRAVTARPVAAPSAAEPTALAVLPLACAPGDEYLADGILEDLTDALSTAPGLRVRPAGIVRSQTAVDPRELGRQLQVDHVVSGSLRRTPNGLRLSARLIGVAEGFQVWAHKVDFAESEVLAISEQLVASIAKALSSRANSGQTRPTDPRAVELFLRARAEQRRFWASHQQAAADMLEKAAEYAPSSAQILGALAHASVLAWVMRGLPELAERARKNLERGLAAGHGDAYLASAQYHFNKGEFERGGHDLGVALVRAPMSAPAHELAGNILVEIDSPTNARQHYETAMGLDPGRSHVISTYLARLDALESNFTSADERLAALLANHDPSIVQIARINEARLAGWRGQRDNVLAAAQKFAPRMGGGAEELTDLVARAIVKGELDHNEWTEKWSQFRIRGDAPVRQALMGMQIVAELLLLLGEQDSAFDSLEAAARTGLMDVVWLDGCPLFVALRASRRFTRIRDQVAARASRVLAAVRASTG